MDRQALLAFVDELEKIAQDKQEFEYLLKEAGILSSMARGVDRGIERIHGKAVRKLFEKSKTFRKAYLRGAKPGHLTPKIRRRIRTVTGKGTPAKLPEAMEKRRRFMAQEFSRVPVETELGTWVRDKSGKTINLTNPHEKAFIDASTAHGMSVMRGGSSPSDILQRRELAAKANAAHRDLVSHAGGPSVATAPVTAQDGRQWARGTQSVQGYSSARGGRIGSYQQVDPYAGTHVSSRVSMGGTQMAREGTRSGATVVERIHRPSSATTGTYGGSPTVAPGPSATATRPSMPSYGQQTAGTYTGPAPRVSSPQQTVSTYAGRAPQPQVLRQTAGTYAGRVTPQSPTVSPGPTSVPKVKPNVTMPKIKPMRLAA